MVLNFQRHFKRQGLLKMSLLANNNPADGLSYLVRGFKMLREPGIRYFAWAPVAVNILIFSSLGYYSIDQFSGWSDSLLANIPGWASFLEWLLWPLFILLLAIIMIFSFTIIANIIAAPFNAILAELVEQRLAGEAPPSASENWKQTLVNAPRSLLREFSRLAYVMPLAIAIWIITIIPLFTVFAPALWFLWGAWMMAIQYSDYPADNNKVSFKALRQTLAQKRLLTLGFGAGVTAFTLVPVVNLFVMPAAVCGASIMWCERLKEACPSSC